MIEKKGRLVIEAKIGDTILINFGGAEVALRLTDDNRSSRARILFEAPKSVEIMNMRRRKRDSLRSNND